MAADNKSNKKKEKTGYVKCPACGKVVKSMGTAGHFNFAHPDLVYQEHKEKFEIAPVPPDAEEEEEEEAEESPRPRGDKTRDKRRESLYKRPRKPTEILKGICEEYNCKDRFIKFITKRSKRQGGITPEEFRYRLDRMNSGFNNEEEVRDIAEDYAYSLESEQEKAEELGRPVDYPIQTRPNRSTSTRPTRQGYSARDSGLRTGRTASIRRGMQESYDEEPLTAADVQMLLRETLEEKKEKDKIDAAQDKIDKLTDLIQAQQQQIQQVQQQASQPVVPEGVVTKQDLEKRDSDIYVKHLEETRQQQNQRINDMLNELKQEREKSTEDREKLLDQIQEEREKAFDELRRESSRSAADGYKKDEMKLTADAMHRAADLMETRSKQGRPIEIALRGIEHLDRPRQRPKREKKEGSRKIGLSGIEEEFID